MKKLNLNIVLFEPEIAGNVGTIIRTCVGANATLHLIMPFGFILTSKFIKHASSQYINQLKYFVYDNYQDFVLKNPNVTIFYATRYSYLPHSNINYCQYSTIFLMFGKESTGIKKEILAQNLKFCIRIPMQKNVRCLNLACSVAIVTYEVLRQFNYQNLSLQEVQKGKYFLNQFKK